MTGGNSKIYDVHPDSWGFMIQFDEHLFQMGWSHQLVLKDALSSLTLFWDNQNMQPVP